MSTTTQAQPESVTTIGVTGKTSLADVALDKGRAVLILLVIGVIFSFASPFFLTPVNLSNLVLQTASIAVVSTGIVLVLLLGEIDLSAGAVSGLAAGLMAVSMTYWGIPPFLAIVLALAAAALIGLVQGVLTTILGIPSFIITLAGLLTWQGVLLILMGGRGTVNVKDDGVLALTSTFLPQAVGWIATVVIVVAYFGVQMLARQRDRAVGLPGAPFSRLIVRVATVAAVMVVVVTVLNLDRGVPVALLMPVGIIFLLSLLLTSTALGRHVYAVGGNAVAAGRVGIRVNGIRLAAFVSCSVLAATGGILAASRLQAVTQNAGGSDLLLLAIAGPVIAGVSLFGGRGSVWGALLGALIIGAISNGMDLLSIEASVKLVVTGAVLAVAVALDAFTTKQRKKRGRS